MTQKTTHLKERITATIHPHLRRNKSIAVGYYEFRYLTICLLLLQFIAWGIYAQPSPPWQWARTTGNISNTTTDGACVATDPQSRAVVVAGPFSGEGNQKIAAFDNILLKNPSTSASVNRSRNAFLTKYDSSGKVLWAKLIADSITPMYNAMLGSYAQVNVLPTDMVIDEEGNIYLSGRINGGTIKFDAIVFKDIDNSSGFVIKFNSSGKVIWAQVQKGTGTKIIKGLSLSGQDLFIAGNHAANANFSFGGSNINTSAQGTFVAKLNATSGQLIWYRSIAGVLVGEIGGYGLGSGNIIVADEASCYLAGNFTGTITFGSSTLSCPTTATNYGCILKFSASSGIPDWGKAYGCPQFGSVTSHIAVGQDGSIYTTGTFASGFIDARVKLPNTIYFSDSVRVSLLAVDTAAVSTGALSSYQFFTGYVAKFDASGKALWGRIAITPVSDPNRVTIEDINITSIVLDPKGNLYTVGSYAGAGRGIGSTHFPPVTTQRINSSLHVTKFDPEGYVSNIYGLTSEQFTTARGVYPTDITVDDLNNIYLTGYFSYPYIGFGKDSLFRNDSIPLSNFFVAKLGGCSGAGVLSTVTVNHCGPFTSPSGKYTWSVSGIYYDTVATSGGCDSFLKIELSIKNTASQTLDVGSCYIYTSPSGRYTWNKSGTYSDTLKNQAGCDSILSIRLTINHETYYNLRHTACVSYTAPSGKHVWSSSGLYTDTIRNSNGCDSIINIQLTILPTRPDTTVSVNKTTLTARATGVSYQWVDCGNNFTPIPGATGKNFTPAQSGSYAVIITDGCAAISSCYTLNLGTGIKTVNEWTNRVLLYPNPAQHTVHLQLDVPGRKEIKVLNSLGQEVLSRTTTQAQFSIDLQPYADGIYFFHIWTDAGMLVKKVILNQHYQ